MEKAQADMSDHFKEMVEEVKELKSQLQKPSTNSQEPQPALYSSVLSGQHGSAPRTQERFSDQGLDPRVAEIIELARRTVGLHKIDRDDLARMRLEQYGGATTEEE